MKSTSIILVASLLSLMNVVNVAYAAQPKSVEVDIVTQSNVPNIINSLPPSSLVGWSLSTDDGTGSYSQNGYGLKIFDVKCPFGTYSLVVQATGQMVYDNGSSIIHVYVDGVPNGILLNYKNITTDYGLATLNGEC